MNTTANPPRRTNEMSTIATERLGGASGGELPLPPAILKLDSQALRVGRQAGTSVGAPLPLFNGIGGNIELLAPIARWMLDIPGVGHIARAGSLTKLLRAEVLHCPGKDPGIFLNEKPEWPSPNWAHCRAGTRDEGDKLVLAQNCSNSRPKHARLPCRCPTSP